MTALSIPDRFPAEWTIPMRELAARAFCEARGVDPRDLPIFYAGWENGPSGFLIPTRGIEFDRPLSGREKEAVDAHMRDVARGEEPWPI